MNKNFFSKTKFEYNFTVILLPNNFFLEKLNIDPTFPTKPKKFPRDPTASAKSKNRNAIEIDDVEDRYNRTHRIVPILQNLQKRWPACKNARQG